MTREVLASAGVCGPRRTWTDLWGRAVVGDELLRPETEAPEIESPVGRRRSFLAPVLDRVWPRSIADVRSVAIPAGIVLLALFLRIYRLEIISVNFDTYEQLTATKRLLSGDFPISRIYPSGIAAIMAVPMTVLPRTVITMQAVIISSSVALVGLAYVATKKISGDALAAVLVSLAVACAPRIVYYSRFELFDAINACGVALVIVLVPALRGRAVAVFIAYGVLLAVVGSIRTTNLAVLPAVALYWLDPGCKIPRSSDFRRALLRLDVAAAAISFMLGWTLLALIAGVREQASNAPFTLHGYAARTLYYEAFVFSDLAVWLVLPLAVVGARHLWRRNATVTMVAVYMTVAWPMAHATVHFFEDRYMLPAVFFGFLLAAHGASEILRRTSGRRVLQALCVLVLAGFFGYQLGFDAYLLNGWPARASVGDEAIYRELRPRLAELPDGSLVITAHSRGVRDSDPRLHYLDLIDQSLPSGINGKNVEAMLESIRQAQSEGRDVYYLYSDFEADKLSIGLPGPTYDTYFDAVARDFELTDIFRAKSVPKFRLYRVGKPRQ